MADVVQYRLERMVNELDDLEKRGIFTRREIAEIVKQRRKFEYRLKRPSPLKQDFLAYIDFEMQVDALRLLRKKTMSRNADKKMKKSLSDFAGVARILEIYRLAVVRYKGDIDLWFRYLEFCKQRRNGRMKKVLAQVIRFHPRVPGVYIYAAAWEFDHNLNVAAARALMQHGLRECPTSEELWVEYLRMELTYLNKLKARKVALGEDKGTLVHKERDVQEEQWKEDNKELFLSLDEKEGNNDVSNSENDGSEKLDLLREQALNIFQTIYSGALDAIPSSFNLRKQFLDILEALDLAYSEEMREKVLTDLKNDFSKEPEYWDWLARLEVDPKNMKEINGRTHSQLQKVLQVFEEGLKFVPTSSYFDLYTRFLKEIIDLAGEETQSSSSVTYIEDYISNLLMVYEKSETLGCITEDLAYQHLSFYLQLGRWDEAKKLAEKLCSGKFPDSVRLWHLRISVEARCITRNAIPSNSDMLSVFELLKHILTKVSPSDAEDLWLMALKLFANQKKYFDKLVEISLVSLAKHGGGDNGFSLSSAIVNFILQKEGIQRERETYNRFLSLPRPGLSLYKNCIELEENLACIGNNDCLKTVRKLYASALATYDQNVGLWRDYYSMELKLGTSETVNAVYWRARKTLKDASALVAPAVAQ